MGAANCCKKPDEIVIEELKNISSDDNNKINAIDHGGFPQDTEQIYGNNVNGEEDNVQGISNRNLYEQEGITSKIGGTYEVPINESNESNPQQNYEEDNQNQQEEGQYEYQENENEEQNEYEERNQEEEGEEYNNEGENMNDLREVQENQQEIMDNMQNIQKENNSANVGGVDLNSLTSLQQGNENLPNSVTVQPQQGGGLDINKLLQQNEATNSKHINENIATVTPLVGNDDINKYFQQKNLTQSEPSISQKQKLIIEQQKKIVPESNEQNQNVKQSKTEIVNIDMKDLPEVFGSSDINKYKQTTVTTTTKTMGNIDMKDLPEVFGSSDINKYKQITTTTKTETKGQVPVNPELLKIQRNEELPSTFGSSDINKLGLKGQPTANVTTIKTIEKTNLKEEPEKKELNDDKNLKETTTTTTKVIQNIDMKDLPEVFGSSDINNYKQTTTTTTTKIIGNLDMKDLPEVFGSSDIAHYKQTTTTTETKGKNVGPNEKNLDSKNNNNVKQVITTTTKEGFIDMKDLPEVFGSSDINKYKQTKTTTTTKTIGNVDKKISPNNNDFKHTTTTITKEGIIDMKDLPEVFGSSDINKYKQTKTTTTTTKTIGNIDMKDLPEVFGSYDINKYKKITTTTTTKTIGTNDKSGKIQSSTNNNPILISQTQNIEKVPSSFAQRAGNVQQTTTTTTTKTMGNAPIDLKEFGLEPNASNNPIIENEDYNQYFNQLESNTGSKPIDLKQFGLENNVSTNQANENEDYSQYFKQFESQTGTEPIDLKQFGLEQNLSNTSNLQQTTTTTTTTKISDGNKNQTTTTKVVKSTQNPAIDFKQFGIVENQGTDNEDYSKYFQESNTTTTKITGSEPIDLKQYGIDINSLTNNNGSFNVNNATGSQTTTTKVTKTSYVGPTQSYSYNYSYNLPTTTTSKVTKTTYTGVQP